MVIYKNTIVGDTLISMGKKVDPKQRIQIKNN